MNQAKPAAPFPRSTESRAGGTAARTLVALTGAASLAACVTVEVPSEPIVIQLDLNIRQEVVYSLAGDAGNTIQQNPEIF